MNCLEQECACPELCSVADKCILTHDLLKGNYFDLIGKIRSKSKNKRAKFIISLLEAQKPFRVSQAQVDKYYFILKKTGYDPDRKSVKK